jgi:hypothetical protein
MFCRHCGIELPDIAVFCMICGKPISSESRKEVKRYFVSVDRNDNGNNLSVRTNSEELAKRVYDEISVWVRKKKCLSLTKDHLAWVVEYSDLSLFRYSPEDREHVWKYLRGLVECLVTKGWTKDPEHELYHASLSCIDTGS